MLCKRRSLTWWYCSSLREEEEQKLSLPKASAASFPNLLLNYLEKCNRIFPVVWKLSQTAQGAHHLPKTKTKTNTKTKTKTKMFSGNCCTMHKLYHLPSPLHKFSQFFWQTLSCTYVHYQFVIWDGNFTILWELFRCGNNSWWTKQMCFWFERVTRSEFETISLNPHFETCSFQNAEMVKVFWNLPLHSATCRFIHNCVKRKSWGALLCQNFSLYESRYDSNFCFSALPMQKKSWY